LGSRASIAVTPIGTAAWPARWALWARSSRRILSRRSAGTGVAVSLATREAGGAKALGEMTGIAPSNKPDEQSWGLNVLFLF
jgi:hypothetical protein